MEDRALTIEGLSQEKNKNEIIRAATDNDVTVWSMDPRDPNNFLDYENARAEKDTTAVDDPIENVALGLNIGRDQVFSSFGKVAQWMSSGKQGKDLTDLAEKSMAREQSFINKPLKEMNLTDSRFWTQIVPQQIPFMATLAPIAMIGAAGGTSAA